MRRNKNKLDCKSGSYLLQVAQTIHPSHSCCCTVLFISVLYLKYKALKLWGGGLCPVTTKGGRNSCGVNRGSRDLGSWQYFSNPRSRPHHHGDHSPDTGESEKKKTTQNNIESCGNFLPGHSSDEQFHSEDLGVVLLRLAMSTSHCQRNGKQVQCLVRSATVTLQGVRKPISPPIY